MPTAEVASEFTVHHALDAIHKAVLARNMKTHWRTLVAPVHGKYFTDHSPINGEPLAEIAKSTAEDVEKALDAAHAAKYAWGHTSPAARAEILLKIADKLQENLEILALAETIDNGKPSRDPQRRHSSLHRPFPLLRCLCAGRRGRAGELDQDTVAYHFKEPLGVVGQIIPWNFPC